MQYQELRATLVIVRLLNETSVQICTAPPVDDEEDETLDRSAGEILLDVTDDDTRPRLITVIREPDPVHNWR